MLSNWLEFGSSVAGHGVGPTKSGMEAAMKAFLLSVVAVILIAVASFAILNSVGLSTMEKYVTSNVRL
jgi:hypothetical protein